jgi:hypothetical protein
MNWYAYCGNDPVNFIDPEGMRALTDAELKQRRRCVWLGGEDIC